MLVSSPIKEEDYVLYELHKAVKKKQIYSFALHVNPGILIGNAVITIVFYLITGDYIVGIGFCVFSFLIGIAYPLWGRKHYFKKYTDLVKEKYKAVLDSVATIQIDESELSGKEKGKEWVISSEDIDEIVELPGIIIIELKNGNELLLPKNAGPETKDLVMFLQKLAERVGATYSIEKNWAWQKS